ncbi:MAG: exosortase/archaeosortase family protein [Caldilineaceae bacterium]|nr:exosortase/archaeosortase family protein [Caldilineaceae bacterium]
MTSKFSQAFITTALITSVFLLLTLPVWQWLWREWMGNDYYSHGVLIPLVTLYLIVQRFRRDATLPWPPRGGSNLGLVLLIPGLLLYLYFLNGKAYYLAAFAMIGLLAGLIWTLGGTLTLRKLLFPVAYLIFMVPVPFIERSTLPLAMFTGVCSTGLVRVLGLEMTVTGNAITLPNADLVIGAQCSGINSLIALLALTTLAAYLFDGPVWARIVLVLLAFPLALLGNILRVASLLFVAAWQGADAAFIFYHDYSGPVFFVLMLALLALLARSLRVDKLRLNVI